MTSLIAIATMDNSKQPLLKPRPSDAANPDERFSDAGSPTNGVVNSINASGPQLCYSPPPYYDSMTGTHPPHIQDEDVSGSAAEEIKVYKRRWYILLVFSVLAATQGGLWNMYGPISATVEDAFGWTDSTIALLSNWGPIAYLVAGLIFSWMLDVKGLRLSCIVTALLVAIGTGLKCITFDTPAVTWLTHVGQLLNGLGGPVAMAAAPILSAMWFPPSERTTATAIGAVFNGLGIAISFIMGPLLMPGDSTNSTTNASLYSSLSGPIFSHDYADSDDSSFVQISNASDADQISKERKAVALYTYIGAGWSGFVFLLLLVYFPKKPPLPPCPSAAIQREDFLQGLKLLMTHKQFWLVATIYGTSLGTLNCWSSVLDVILKPHGINENEAGWIGFYATCSACLGSLVIARFADFFKRIMKWLILVSYIIGTAAFVVFALTVTKVIPPSNALFYVTIITGITSLNAAVPLMFELSCELSYPAGEGTTNIILTIANNFFGLIFLLLLTIPGIGSEWTIWILVGTSGGCLPLLLLMKERYNRLEIDEHHPSLNAQIVFPSPQQ